MTNRFSASPVFPDAASRSGGADFPVAGYRADIDGLRAVAILAVLLFHGFPELLPGGFAGVDVFFVISGFLIAGIIFGNIEQGNFRFSVFYANRIRRIFPALILLLAAAYVIGWNCMDPGEFARLGKHIAASAGFSNNFVLWGEAGYFDRATELKPLMHLWSLGIEEQFYLVFPVLVWGLSRWPRGVWPMLAVLAAVSFVSNAAMIVRDPGAAFFLPATRAWELLAGSLLAHAARKAALPNAGRDAASAAGLALLAAAFAVLDGKTAYPGGWALLPVAATLLLIAAGPSSFGNRRILAHPAMVAVGRISYPLYLWHWLLLSFMQVVAYRDVSWQMRCVALAASFILAWLTYRLVERPVRFGSRRRWKTIGLCIAVALVGYVGFNAWDREGLPFRQAWKRRYPEVVRDVMVLKFDDDRWFRSGVCHLNPHNDLGDFSPLCADAGNAGKPTVFLWGDSYAAHLYPGIASNYPDIRFEQYTAAGCQPILDWDVPGFPKCRAINDHIFSLIASGKPEHVVLSSWWLGYGEGERIRETVGRLYAAGVKDVLILGPVPRWHGTLYENLFAIYRTAPFDAIPRRLSVGLDASVADADRAMRRAAADSRARYLSPLEMLCDGDGCLIRPDEPAFDRALMNFDGGHLTPEGSRYLVRRIAEGEPAGRGLLGR